MARVTVEDCVQLIPNRFELVLLAAQRARDINSGSLLTVERDNDKNAVVALREIAEETIDLDALRHELEHGRDFEVEVDEPEEESMAMLSAEQAWADVTSKRPAEKEQKEPEAADGEVILDEAGEPESTPDAGDEEPPANKSEEI